MSSLTFLCLALIAGPSIAQRVGAQLAESRQPRPDCGNRTFIPYQAGPARAPLAEYPVKQRCSNYDRPFGDRLLVVASNGEDTSWMIRHISVPFLVYHQTGSAESDLAHVFSAGAREAGGYLRFIAEYYDCLPEVVLFAHPHRQSSWHSTNNLDYNIDHVNWEKVPGYAILHRKGLWWESAVKDPFENLPVKAEVASASAKCDQIVNQTAYDWWWLHHFWLGNWMLQAWDILFKPEGFGEVPEKLKASKASEFFVTREKVLARPRSFYLRSLQYIHEETLKRQEKQAGSWSEYNVGLIFEHTWHHIFGEPMFMMGLTIPECQLYRCEQSFMASSTR